MGSAAFLDERSPRLLEAEDAYKWNYEEGALLSPVPLGQTGSMEARACVSKTYMKHGRGLCCTHSTPHTINTDTPESSGLTGLPVLIVACTSRFLNTASSSSPPYSLYRGYCQNSG